MESGQTYRQSMVMKAKIEVTIRDDAGNVIGQLDPQMLDLGKQSLHDIEGAIEAWRQKALPDIESALLSASQQQFVEEKKQWMEA